MSKPDDYAHFQGSDGNTYICRESNDTDNKEKINITVLDKTYIIIDVVKTT